MLVLAADPVEVIFHLFGILNHVFEPIAKEQRVAKLIGLRSDFFADLLVHVSHIEGNEGLEENTVYFGLNCIGLLADCRRVDHIVNEQIPNYPWAYFMK